MKKYSTIGLATDGNMAQALSMLDDQGYEHTLRICNTYCFSKTTVVTLKLLNITLYVDCLSC
jgi:hypothetical protein